MHLGGELAPTATERLHVLQPEGFLHRLQLPLVLAGSRSKPATSELHPHALLPLA